MIAILTKYLGPTDNRSSRVRVTTSNGHRLIVPWDDNLNADENHRAAAFKLCNKMGWTGDLASGGPKDGAAHCFIPGRKANG